MKVNAFSVIAVASFVVCTVAFLSSCDKNSDDGRDDEDLEWGTDGDQTSNLVKQNVVTTVGYKDYAWNISIHSRLASAFPGKSITYGIEFGYDAYNYYQEFKFNNDFQTNDGNGNMTIIYPVFGPAGKYVEENIYWDSYLSLKEKQSKGQTLTNDEKSLLSSIIQYLNQSEYGAKNSFCGRLYAQIDGKRYYFCIIGKVPSDNQGNSGGSDDGGSGGSTSYEKPDISFYDYTPYTTKLKVVYKINNKSNTQVSSAKIYYGTSSNPSSSVSATVSSGQISATITGLKSGTTYYVKCTATGKGGTATTSTTRLMTEY